MIPMLTRLEMELAQCADPIRQAELLAERASYLARTGHFAEANEILSTLRKSYGDGRSARVSVWIMFVEGLVLYFERISVDARDKILRAHTISSAAGISDMRLLTAAWLAHLEFERSKYDDMGRLLAAVIEYPGESSPGVRSRVALVLGDAFAYSGDRVKSQLWFEFCRRRAVDAGDRATMGALMYNRPAFRLARLRVEHFVHDDTLDPDLLRLLEMELNSSWEFQIGTNVAALSHLVKLAKAQVLIFREKFVEAIEVLLVLREQLALLENRPNRSSVLAELGWCFLKNGNTEAAYDSLRDIDLVDIRCLDVDDRLVAFSMLIKIAESMGDRRVTNVLECELLNAHTEYDIDMASLATVLNSEVFWQIPGSW